MPEQTMTALMNADNPFDLPHGILKTLQTQVAELQMGLEAEREDRANEVGELRMILEAERAARAAWMQQMEHTIGNEVRRLEDAQHRVRFDVGDLRTSFKEETGQQQANCESIRQDIQRLFGQLDKDLKEFRTLEMSHYTGSTTAIQEEAKSREAACTSLEKKFDGKVEELTTTTDNMQRDLSNWRDAFNKDYAIVKQYNQDLINDVESMTGHLQNLGQISGTFRSFEWHAKASLHAPGGALAPGAPHLPSAAPVPPPSGPAALPPTVANSGKPVVSPP